MRSARGSRSRNPISPRRSQRLPARTDRDRPCAWPGLVRDRGDRFASRTERGSDAMAASGSGLKPVHRRVIVKVSGEALTGPDGFGIHQPTIDRIAADIAAAHKLGVTL